MYISVKQLYLALSLSGLIVFTKVFEVFNSARMISINMIVEYFITFLLSFLSVMFISSFYKWVSKDKVSKYLSFVLFLSSFSAYFLHLYDIRGYSAYNITESMLFTNVFILIMTPIIYFLKKSKFKILRFFIILIFIPLSLFIIFKLNSNHVSDEEHSSNMEVMHVSVGSMLSLMDIYILVSRIDSIADIDKFKNIKIIVNKLILLDINSINSNILVQKILQKHNYCDQWNKLEQDIFIKYMDLENNQESLNKIYKINNLCETQLLKTVKQY